MDPQWVLTPGQKKVRFRHLMKRRKSDIANADADENGPNDTQDNLNNDENSNDSAANISHEYGSDNYCAEASSSSQSSMSSYGIYASKGYKDGMVYDKLLHLSSFVFRLYKNTQYPFIVFKRYLIQSVLILA